jgi:DNA primase
MRFLLKVSIPVEAGNEAARRGRLAETIAAILAEQKPEAVYFAEDKGQRTGFIFLDMQDASQIPALAEPWFLAFNASIEFHPVMIPDDLKKATPHIQQAVKKYGKQAVKK